MRRPARWLALVLALAGVAAAAAGPDRVVAVGDVHGDRDALAGVLERTGLVDRAGHWSGGTDTLVQVGDLIDRGPESREVLDLLMALETEAAAAGGRVVAILGNHEAMNLYGDLRYLVADDYRSFADGGSGERRRLAFAELGRWLAERGSPGPAPAEAAWMEAHPPGFLERMTAFAPEGRYGRWLRRLPAAAQIGGVVFLHGGVAPAFAGESVESIVTRVAAELGDFDTCRRRLIDKGLALDFFTFPELRAAARGANLAECRGLVDAGEAWSRRADGPLWYRGYSELGEDDGLALLAGLWSDAGADHFVVGHTPQTDGRVHCRFGGRAFLIDTGMLAGYIPCGCPAALEIQGGVFTAVYADGAEPLLLSGAGTGAGTGAARPAPPAGAWVWPGPDGTALPFAGEDEMLEYLRTARVIETKDIGQGVTHPRQVLLERGGVRMHAVFRDVDVDKPLEVFPSGRVETYFRDSALFECAAYELSRLLGIGHVPPVVRRTLGGKRGSLQAWVERAVTEGARLKRGLAAPDPARWERQAQLLRLFDNLVANTDRNAGNTLYDPDFTLWMIDHTRAFRRTTELQHPEVIERCQRGVWERLRGLDEAEVRRRLKPYLRPPEIDALLVRRGKLVAYLERLIAERGEAAVLFAGD